VKKVGNTWLPATETHMVEWMEKQQQWRHGKLCYQLHKYDLAMKYVTKRDVAVDVGAHVGTWSMLMVHDFQHVIAFEPSARAEIYPLNVEKENYALHRMALSDHAGTVAMQEIDWSTGGCHVIAGREGDIECDTLDSFGLETVDFLKIDVEGHELPMVNGAIETIKRCRPVVLIEQKGWNHNHVKDGNRDAVKFLQSLGMKVATEYSGDIVCVW
jgi:FkbM family methyltransferase